MSVEKPATPSATPILWSNVMIAAVLMLATLPGRTQGLGLINAWLVRDLALDEVFYGMLNIWTTLLGAIFCLPTGTLLDRFGLRWVSTALVVCLGLVIWRMSVFPGGTAELFLLLLLTRGFGQSALSVASVTTVGRSAGSNAGFAMGVFAVVMTFLMAGAFGGIQAAVGNAGHWRFAWGWVAAVLLLGIAPLVASFLREPGVATAQTAVGPSDDAAGFTLAQALRTKAFWIFCLAMGLFSLASAGLSFWNTLVFAKQGYDANRAGLFIALMAGFGLAGQFGAGWLTRRYGLSRLFGGAMALYAAALAILPSLSGTAALVFASALFGVSGAAVMVVFFTIWSATFGQAQLGRIQGAAQVSTVIASALGPWLFALCNARFGSYAPLLYPLAALSAMLAIACWRAVPPVPK